MASSPAENSSGVLKLSILSEGSAIDDTIEVQSVTVNKAINRIPSAKIVMADGDMPDRDFPVSNQSTFAPGSAVTIKAGYGDEEETIFEGIVIKHGLKISGNNDARLVIECRDKAVAMTIGRKNANYVDSKDSDIISTVVSNHSGLSATVDATNTQHGEIVQYYSTDWDFILARAEANGLLVCCDSAKLTVQKPQTDGSADLKVSYGDDLMEFSADVDARHQLTKVQSNCWDPSTQAIVNQEVAPETLNSQGNLDSATLAKVLGLSSFNMQTVIPMDSTALKDWATAQQRKAGLARIRGRMKFQGSAKAKIGTLLDVDGVGDRFNGSVFVSAVNQNISRGNWITDVEFGLSPNWFTEQPDVMAPPAAGLLPGVEGLQVGVVKQLDQDPAGNMRVQVTVPLLQAETQGVWARLANFYASNSFGAFFIPEIGDEVVLGYLNNDPSHPVIIGSLYSSKMVPPYDLTADNYTKALVTKTQLKLEFDDENKVVTVVTPGGNSIVISDKDKAITLTDQTGNKIEMSDSGITLDSPKDIKITATGDISMEATGKIALSATSDASLEGMNVDLSAQVGFTAQGNATAELSASGQTTVKGAMVMIN